MQNIKSSFGLQGQVKENLCCFFDKMARAGQCFSLACSLVLQVTLEIFCNAGFWDHFTKWQILHEFCGCEC